VLLLFRLGDFYEMFFEDARRRRVPSSMSRSPSATASRCAVCPTMPHRATSRGSFAPGKRVAIGEQLGDVVPGKLVERGLSEIISGGHG